MGNKPVLAIVLILVIVACIAFMVHNSTKKKGGSSASGGSQERDFVCLSCDKHFTTPMKDEEWMPLQMQGKNAQKKLKCPECGKDEGVAAQKCPNCGEWVPVVGMMGMMGQGASGGMKAPVCPKCKKPMASAAPGGAPVPAK